MSHFFQVHVINNDRDFQNPEFLNLTIEFSKRQIDNNFFSYFSLKTGFDISCILSPVETICMICRILFSEKEINKNNSKCRLLQILPRVLSCNKVWTIPFDCLNPVVQNFTKMLANVT